MSAPTSYGYHASDDEINQGLAFIGLAARSSVGYQIALFQTSLRDSVIRAADELAMRRGSLGPCQPIDRVGLGKFNLNGNDYWRQVFSSSIAEEIARNEQYCQIISNRRIESIVMTGGQYDSNGCLIPGTQTQQTIWETPDTTHARLNRAYVTTCLERWNSERLVATSSGIIKGWATAAYHKEIWLKGISGTREDLRGAGLDFGETSWVGTVLIPSGLPGWAAQCQDAQLVASLFCLCPMTLEAIHQSVLTPFHGFHEYSFFSSEYNPGNLGVDHSTSDGNTPIYLSRDLAERSSVWLVIANPGGNICRRHTMTGHSFCTWVRVFSNPLPISVARSIFTDWMCALTSEDSWKSTLGSSENTVDVYEVQRVLRQEDVAAHDALLVGKQKAMRKKIFTLGIAGGDLKRNSAARSDLLVTREQRRLQVDTMAILGDTIHSAADLEGRDGRWLESMVHAPLWLAQTAQARAKMPAMNMAWIGSSSGKVQGDIYCHLAMSYNGDTPLIAQSCVVGHVDTSPDKAAIEIHTMIKRHAASLGALMQTAVFCRAIYNAPPLRKTEGSLFG